MLLEEAQIQKLELIFCLQIECYILSSQGPRREWIVVAAVKPSSLRIGTCQQVCMMINPVFPAVLLAHFLDFPLIQTLNLPGQACLALDIFDTYHSRNGSQIIEHCHLFFLFSSRIFLGIFIVPSLELRFGPTALPPIGVLL
jgi:hypothetical protein